MKPQSRDKSISVLESYEWYRDAIRAAPPTDVTDPAFPFADVYDALAATLQREKFLYEMLENDDGE